MIIVYQNYLVRKSEPYWSCLLCWILDGDGLYTWKLEMFWSLEKQFVL